MREATISRTSLLVDGSDQAFRAFIHDLLGFAARLQSVREGFGVLLGLSGPAYTCLMAVAFLADEADTGINRVARHLHLSPAFVTLEIAKLVKRGLVRKKVDSRDRRRVQLSLTKKGEQVLGSLSGAQVPVNDALFAGLSRADFAALRRMLPGLVESSDQALALLEPMLAKRGSEPRTKRKAAA